MEENMQASTEPPSEAQMSETVITPEAVLEVKNENDSTTVDEQNGNCNQAQAKMNNNRNNNFKNKNRRRKRSFRSRKNSNQFKFHPKGLNRDLLFNRDQVRRHQLFFSDSQRLVPYNTNSFLMEEHYPKIAPNFNYNPSNSHDSFSSSDCGMSGSIDEDEFLTKEFHLDYENLRSEQLHEMTKEQLVSEYLKLENQTELSIKAKENEILSLNNKIKELTRLLKHGKTMINGDHQEFSSSSDSDSSSSSETSSSSSKSETMENGDAAADYPVINDSIEQPTTAIVETVSC